MPLSKTLLPLVVIGRHHQSVNVFMGEGTCGPGRKALHEYTTFTIYYGEQFGTLVYRMIRRNPSLLQNMEEAWLISGLCGFFPLDSSVLGL